jgi:hypothetical protein
MGELQTHRKDSKVKKKIFEGYTTKEINPCWTYFNNVNLTAVIQKTKNEAYCRYGNDDLSNLKDIIKVRITIEQIEDK